MISPALFGLKKSNRDFTSKDSWGKNQFNSSFPASLCAYFESENLDANYINVRNKNITIEPISIKDLFGKSSINPDEIFYAFESEFSPYNTYIKGVLPRTDLVIQDLKTKTCLRGLEVKLTALPDQSTFNKKENEYGSEIVVRPDTIVYLACSLIESIEKSGVNIDGIRNIGIIDWEDPQEVIDKRDVIHDAILKLSQNINDFEVPVLLQPVWKTIGKSPLLSDHCLDIFVWSNSGLSQFICEISKASLTNKNPKVTRQFRTSIWIVKMLLEYSETGSFEHKDIIDKLSYNVKNDKAFSSPGNVTNKFMSCTSLKKPRITKDNIKNIILGEGQSLLSPERRFDAIIFNSPDLFN